MAIWFYKYATPTALGNCTRDDAINKPVFNAVPTNHAFLAP